MTAARKNGQRVGYTRVSSADQNNSRQLEGISVDKIFADKTSGKDRNRPQLQAALSYLRDGDVLVVHSMDRLARNLDDLRKIVDELNAKGVAVEFCKEKLTFNGSDGAMATLLLNVMGAFAQFERELIKERQREGIQIAKKDPSKYRGRRPSLTSAQVTEIRAKVDAGANKAALAKVYRISRQTLYTALHVPGLSATGEFGH